MFRTKVSEGFTIVELLVVLAIISVLTSIVMANVVVYLGRGKNSSIKANIDSAYKAQVLYYFDNGQYIPQSCNISQVGAIANAAPVVGGIAQVVCGYSAVGGVGAPVTAWCLCSALYTTPQDPAGSSLCTDYTGYNKQTTNGCSLRCLGTPAHCAD